jgi:hypothetical protein
MRIASKENHKSFPNIISREGFKTAPSASEKVVAGGVGRKGLFPT